MTKEEKRAIKEFEMVVDFVSNEVGTVTITKGDIHYYETILNLVKKQQINKKCGQVCVDGIIACILLIVGIFTKNIFLIIASGIFEIASNIYKLKKIKEDIYETRRVKKVV